MALGANIISMQETLDALHADRLALKNDVRSLSSRVGSLFMQELGRKWTGGV